MTGKMIQIPVVVYARLRAMGKVVLVQRDRTMRAAEWYVRNETVVGWSRTKQRSIGDGWKVMCVPYACWLHCVWTGRIWRTRTSALVLVNDVGELVDVICDAGPAWWKIIRRNGRRKLVWMQRTRLMPNLQCAGRTNA